MAKTASETVAGSINKTVEAGGARVTMTLNPLEAAAWRLLLAKHPGRGGQKTAFMVAVRAALEQGEPTDDELVDMMRRRLASRG